MIESTLRTVAKKLAVRFKRSTIKTHLFLRTSAGVSSVEYAVMLAIIIGVACTGAGLLSKAVNQSVEKLAIVDTNPPTSSDDIESEVDSNILESTSDYFSKDHHWLHLLGSQVVTFTALGIVLYILRRERKRKEAEGDSSEITSRIIGTAVQNQLYKKRQQIYRLLSNDMTAVLASRMDVRHVMSERVKIVSPSTPVAEIKATMKSKQFHHLVVCDQAGKLVGIISDRDVFSRTGETASDIMTKRPLTVKRGTLIIPTVTMMIEQRISCLPVVNESGELEGLLTSTDLMLALQCALQTLHKLAGELDLEDSSSDLIRNDDEPESKKTESANNPMPISCESSPTTNTTGTSNLL